MTVVVVEVVDKVVTETLETLETLLLFKIVWRSSQAFSFSSSSERPGF